MVSSSEMPPRTNATVRGLLIMTGGLVLLLHTMGLLQKGLSLILIIAALAAIAYGFYISGLYDMVVRVTHRR